MTAEELEHRILALRSRPLLLVCRDGKGRQKIMSLEECRRTGSVYVHTAADDLDALLSAELGVDALPVENQKCNKTAHKKAGQDVEGS